MFDNINRNRYYGVRVGDIVNCEGRFKHFKDTATVVRYGFMDNNCVYVEQNGKIIKGVAEWLTIIKKVEDV